MLSTTNSCPTNFYAPFNMVVAGPSQVGKTTFVQSLLSKPYGCGSIIPHIDRIKYVYGEEAPNINVDSGTRIDWCKGWSSQVMEDMHPANNNLIVLDDVANDCKDDPTLSNMFTRGGHHRNISIILLTQNYFFSGRTAIDIRRNTHYLVLFACKQDKGPVATFAQRLFPTGWKNFLSAYNDATSIPHGHLLVDMTTKCPEQYMLRAKTLDDRPVVYLI